MDGRHPNRKKDKLNPYTLSIENGISYISFIDGQGVFHKQEISKELYAAFNSFELEDISHMNIVSRHMEQSELTEESLINRAATPPEPVEDYVNRKIIYQNLHNAIAQLPEIQRRRIVLYYFGGYTYEQIAKMEGCKHPAIMKSVAAAEKNIKRLLSK
jgi:RNA polymerase sigma-70 factor (ECF subfamily)